MTTTRLTNAQLDSRILFAQKLRGFAKAFDPNVQLGSHAPVDDKAVLRAIAREAMEQKAHAGAAAAAKANAKSAVPASAQPVAALRAPSPAATPADVRVAPTSSGSGAKARGFADRARTAAK